MGIRFNAEEVLEMAVRAEAGAAVFYRKAAELKAGGETATDFLLHMADMEVKHQKTFGALKDELSASERERTAFDPYSEAILYLNAMADSSIAEGSPAATEALTGDESLEDIIRSGIQAEKGAVLFYMGIKEMVSDELGQSKIEEIIQEEKSHIVILAKELRKLKGE